MSVITTLFKRRARIAGSMLLLALTLSACGFHLRGSGGQYNLPFNSVYLGFAENSPLGNELKRNVRAIGSTQVLPDATGAEAVLDVLSETRGKSILSLNNQGRVREYLLTYTLVFRVRDSQGAQLLAKEGEETLLNRDMQTDLVQQVMRRLAAIKPAKP